MEPVVEPAAGNTTGWLARNECSDPEGIAALWHPRVLSFFSSFPNSIWERDCRRNSLAAFPLRSSEPPCEPSPSFPNGFWEP